MLQIKNISKQYKTGDLVQNALNDVSLNFRDNEFVSILGPSGSGKTTLLNIIGGLDRYDSGNLIINNVSTDKYKDRDWDSYRNHTIGFVFQSYNLIPHQSVLSNVELALTISGVSKKERRARAIEALERVGLKEQIHKKPNQMSGGQMQRVAIARALVNNPDILLADEPTGALDTETSVQVMELLREVADDRLVIMVTHNPELAEKYSTRIVNLKDGQIVGDTNPFNPEAEVIEPPRHRNMGKASMSVFTALSLSLKNLLTKKGRTILTAFAGSIGIIGIALILAVSSGFQNYVDKIQEDTLTSYPLTINKESADPSSMLLSMKSDKEDDTEIEEGIVEESQLIQDMFSKIGTNDIVSFRAYLDENADKVNGMVSHTENKYGISPLIYSDTKANGIMQLNPSTIMTGMRGGSFASSRMSVFNQMLDDRKALDSQYEILAGRWAESYDEVILVLPDANSMSDMLVYSLGLRDKEEFGKLIAKDANVKKSKPLSFTYNELMQLPLKLVDASDTYKYNKEYKLYENMTDDEKYMKKVYDNAIDLKIVGIVTEKEGVKSGSLSTGICYTKELSEYVINKASQSEIVKKQLKNENVNALNGKRFDEKSTDMGIDFQDMISIDKAALSEAFGNKVDEKTISDLTQGYMTEISSAITSDTTPAEKSFRSTLKALTTKLLNDYIAEKGKNGYATIKLNSVDKLVERHMKKDESTALLQRLEKNYAIPQDTFNNMYSELITAFLKQSIMLMNTNPENDNPGLIVYADSVDTMVKAFVNQDMIIQSAQGMAAAMTEAKMQKVILSKVGELTTRLMQTMSSAFKVDEEKIASAFKFELDEDEVKRLMESMSTASTTQNADSILTSLGYQDMNEPSSISFYFKDFEAKEAFMTFLDDYNKEMEKTDDGKVIKYNDLTGMLMSAIKTIVDAVSYVLIAFVSISLVVSSIMIGIITYISVLERKKEIGILRAIGASKRNISSIFNAETFIVGLLAGLLGIGITLLLLLPINAVMAYVAGDIGIGAALPAKSGLILIILSIILTLIGGVIPSKKAAKKDPVLALRSE